jgi:hypothetical protein
MIRLWRWCVIVWLVAALAVITVPSAQPAEPEQSDETELTFTDKANIAGGCFLACLMSSGPPSYDERYVEEIRIIGGDEIVEKEVTKRKKP